MTQNESSAPCGIESDDQTGQGAKSTFVTFGKVFDTQAFKSDEAANAFMAVNAGWGLIGIDEKGKRHVAQTDDKGKELPPVKYMRCCCCSTAYSGRQFHNQDTGYGLGDCCVEYVAERTDDMERTYGRPGIHYNVSKPSA